MKRIAAPILAVATLVGVSAAHASTVATFSVAETGTGALTANLTGTGLLDSTGVVTLDLAGTITVGSFGSISVTATSVYNGAIVGSTFTPSSGSYTINTCAGALCSFISSALGVAGPFTAEGGSASSVTGGTLTSSFTSSGSTISIADKLTVTSTAPAVPVPAAAWLFGSGVVGLAGAVRRRK